MVEGTHTGKNLKRKWRPSTSQEDSMPEKVLGKLHHHAREVRKAAKKAKAFELQKLVKKIKGLRSKSTDSPHIADLEAQLAILKDCDHEPFANTALKTKIFKDKLLSENEHVKAAVAKELMATPVTPATPQSNEAKVQGRLLSAKIIATEVVSVIDALKIVISPELRHARTEEHDNEVHEDDAEEDSELGHSKKKAKLEDAGVIQADDSPNENEDEDAADAFLRVGAVNEEEAVDNGGWESGSIRENEEVGSDGVNEDEASSADEDEDEVDEAGPSTSSRAGKLSASSKTKLTADTKNSGQSTFLPSLAVGFTRGDSDASDLSDGDVAPKKNRRGQRARRAIWEKKYGRNANHVKHQQEISVKGSQARSRGNTRPRFDKAEDKRRPHQAPGPPRALQPLTRAPPASALHKKEDKLLHPSWEAKKKLKEKQNPVIVPPQGKKIVF